jgi:GcrA cell cycle regulator
MRVVDRAETPWTEEEQARLEELWAQGLSTAAIGREMGRSKNSIVGRVGRSGLPRRASPIKGALPAGKPAAKARRVVPALAALLDASVAPREVDGKVGERPVIVAPLVVVQAVEPAVAISASRSCTWPIGEPGTKGFRYCDAPAVVGRSYCPCHCAVAFVPRRERTAAQAAADAVLSMRVRADKAGQRGRLSAGPLGLT